MLKMKNGFTIVEVMIVVAVIAILAAISIVAYSLVQVDARDSERSSKIAIIADALEKYHKSNNEYPGCAAMTQSGSTVSTTVLVGIDPDVLLAPKSAAGVTNAITCTALVSGSGTDAYAYVGDGTVACNTGAACTSFTLQYRQESTGNVISTSSFYTE